MSHLLIQKKQNTIERLHTSYHQNKAKKHQLRLDLQYKSADMKRCIENLKAIDEEKSRRLYEFSLSKLEYEKAFLRNKILEKELQVLRHKESNWKIKAEHATMAVQRLQTKFDIEHEETNHVSQTLEQLYAAMDHVDSEICKLQEGFSI